MKIRWELKSSGETGDILWVLKMSVMMSLIRFDKKRRCFLLHSPKFYFVIKLTIFVTSFTSFLKFLRTQDYKKINP